MPIDTSMYQNFRGGQGLAGLAQGIQSGLDIANQRKQQEMQAKQMEMQQAQATRQNEAFEMEKQDANRKRTESHMQTLGNTAGNLLSIQDPQAQQGEWMKTREQLIASGMARPQELPENFAAAKPMVSFYHSKAQQAQEAAALENQYKQAQIGKMRAETSKAYRDAKAGGGHLMSLTEGEKSADKDYAKDYNDFTGGGFSKAQDALNKLEEFKTEIENDNGWFQSGGGSIVGSMSDAFRSEAAIARRDNVVSVANSALKATFGGALSDGERKALANEFYNDKLSNAENVKIISRKMAELRNGLEAAKAKAGHYERHRTLAGFKFQDTPYTPGKKQMTADQQQQQKSVVDTAMQALSPQKANANQPKVLKTNQIQWAD